MGGGIPACPRRPHLRVSLQRNLHQLRNCQTGLGGGWVRLGWNQHQRPQQRQCGSWNKYLALHKINLLVGPDRSPGALRGPRPCVSSATDLEKSQPGKSTSSRNFTEWYGTIGSMASLKLSTGDGAPGFVYLRARATPILTLSHPGEGVKPGGEGEVHCTMRKSTLDGHREGISQIRG